MKEAASSMSLGPICELSQELINAIVDIIYEDISREPWTVTPAMHHLYSYPLICSAFLHRSQSHIFAEIRLGKKDGDKGNRSRRNKVLAKLLAWNPHLADHIHSLHLTLPKKDNAWIHKDQHFLRVLPLITDNGRRLKKLTIYGYVDGYIKNPDKAAAHVFRPYISPSISSLHLSGMSKFPLDILKSLIRLKHLKLEGVKAFETPAPFSPPFLRFEGACKLQTVECSYGADCLRNLVAIGKPSSQDPQIDLSALQSMKIYIDKANDIPAARELMQAAGCSLREVHLVRSHFAADFSYVGALSFARLPFLTTVTLKLPITARSTANGLLDGIISILRTIPSKNGLQNLQIAMSGGGEDAREWDTAEWASFDDEVSRISFQKPFNLTVSLYYVATRRRGAKEFASAILENILEHRRLQLGNLPHVNVQLFSTVDIYIG